MVTYFVQYLFVCSKMGPTKCLNNFGLAPRTQQLINWKTSAQRFSEQTDLSVSWCCNISNCCGKWLWSSPTSRVISRQWPNELSQLDLIYILGKEGMCLSWPLCLDGWFALSFSPLCGLCTILLYLLFIYKPVWNQKPQFHSMQKDTSHKWLANIFSNHKHVANHLFYLLIPWCAL